MTAPNTRGSAPVTGLVAAAVLVAVVVGGVLFSGLGGEPAADPGAGSNATAEATPASRPPTGGATSEAERAFAATRTLLEVEQAVRAERETLFDRAFADAPRAADAGDDIFASLSRLPVSTYSLRYIAEVAHERGTWTADVEVQWGLRDFDLRGATTEIQVTFTRADGGVDVLAMRPAPDERAPAWLLGRLQVRRVGAALVLSLQPPLTDRIAAQTQHAVRDVRGVLTGWRGGLVVVLPETTEQLEQMLGAKPGSYDSIAAVTASADGSSGAASPVRVLLNPPVFTGLGPIAGQVVLSHEATHAATGATYRDMPLWLVEGFGDYVALSGEPVPLQVAAGQALDEVRRTGPPRELPGAGDFSASSHGLGASYEAAWLACRLIAQQHGENALLQVYRRTARTGDVDAAFESVLGTSVPQFTADWRAYLRELAE